MSVNGNMMERINVHRASGSVLIFLSCCGWSFFLFIVCVFQCVQLTTEKKGRREWVFAFLVLLFSSWLRVGPLKGGVGRM